MKESDTWTMDYVDSVLIVDKYYNIIHTMRLNPRFDGNLNKPIYSEYLNRNFFEVFPNLKQSESTIVECIQTGKIVFREKQRFTDVIGNVFLTRNLTIPNIKKGEVVGAIELSKDITSIDDNTQSEIEEIQEIQERSIPFETNNKITFRDILTTNEEMLKNIEKAKVYSQNDNPVLIYGETGTGKEMFVQAMVNYNQKRNEKFIVQNCAAIPENLFESLLFGTEAGAYTGAKKAKGLFEIADGGTLFLDEVNSMPINLQAKLLRVLQDRRIRSVGSVNEKIVDIKIIAAMNIDPIEAIKHKTFREDLFYRFSSGTIRLVPLRERVEDITIYIREFIDIYNNRYNKRVVRLSRELMRFFINYEWKGNVRELKHIIESMVSIADCRTLEVIHLPMYMKSILEDAGFHQVDKTEEKEFDFNASLNDTIKRVEKDMIIKALTYTGGNLTKAGELLSIPRQTLKYKIDSYTIDLSKYK